jgi:hypothetical protein
MKYLHQYLLHIKLNFFKLKSGKGLLK